MYIYHDSTKARTDKIQISPLAPGFMHGYGVFETVKVQGEGPVFLPEHLQRLQFGLAALGMQLPDSLETIAERCRELTAANAIERGFLKIICVLDEQGKTETIIHTGSRFYEKEYATGYRLGLAEARRNETSRLCQIKSLNYAENILEQRAASARGFDEALFLNIAGHVSEACRANIFWIKDGRVFTPSLSCGILPGIIRRKIIELCVFLNVPVCEGSFGLDELRGGDEIFLTSSLLEIMPVSLFETRPLDISRNTVTSHLGAFLKTTRTDSDGQS
jgi:branched-subunit amino acid aminotransferase/4-amino-4-deoxychorismate lyase